MIKKTLLGLVVVAVALLIIGMLLPRQVHVERSMTVERPASLVFAVLNSYQRFSQWSPWAQYDPNLKQTIDGPRSGVGAKMSWSGNSKVGTGSQTITAVVDNKSIASDLDFGAMGRSRAAFILQTLEAARTKITWTIDMDMGAGPIGRYFGLGMDRGIGGDFSRGLAKLKTLVETLPNVAIAGLKVTEVSVVSEPLLTVMETTSTDTAAISKGYADGYAKIGKYILKHKLQQRGAVQGIDHEMSPTSYAFEAAVPIAMPANRSDIAAEGNVILKQSYVGKALNTTHIGPYDTLGQTYAKMAAYIAAQAYQLNGASFSKYIDDPTKTRPDALRTELYWPVK